MMKVALIFHKKLIEFDSINIRPADYSVFWMCENNSFKEMNGSLQQIEVPVSKDRNQI
jgi:hypothetical protein